MWRHFLSKTVHDNRGIFLTQLIQRYSNKATNLHLNSRSIRRVAPIHRDRNVAILMRRHFTGLLTYNGQELHLY